MHLKELSRELVEHLRATSDVSAFQKQFDNDKIFYDNQQYQEQMTSIDVLELMSNVCSK